MRSQGLIRPTYRLPYSDQGSLPLDILQEKVAKGDGLVFGHSLTDLIGGQLTAGFLLQDFVEEFAPHARFLIDSYIPTFLASKAIKL